MPHEPELVAAEMAVRQYTDEDLIGVAELWARALPRTGWWNEPTGIVRRKQQVGDGLFFVGEASGRIVATVIAGYDGIRGWIYSLAVDERRRGRGDGRRMMEAAEQALRARGCPKINLQVRSTNQAVIDFYRKLGFEVQDHTSMYKLLVPHDNQPAHSLVPRLPVDAELELTELRASDRDTCVQLLNASDGIARFTRRIPFPYTAEHFDLWLKLIEHPREDEMVWAIRSSDASLLGTCGLTNIVVGHRAEIGYWLGQPYWNRGITSSVVARVCDFAFSQLDLVRLQAEVFAENAASARVLEKCGFEQEGFLRKHLRKQDRWQDVRLFAKLRDAPRLV